MDLIVNGEGDAASTTWTIEGYNQYVAKVFEVKSLFILLDLDITLGDLERPACRTSRRRRMPASARLIAYQAYSEYEALPESQRRASDLVLVKGFDMPTTAAASEVRRPTDRAGLTGGEPVAPTTARRKP